ncbi:unnamed protein product, partial [Brenthis ino]
MDSLTSKLCCGCLHYGRKMIKIDYEYDIKCFSQIISEIPMLHTNTLLFLCYECAALLKKFTKFKLQVRTSYKCFYDYALENFKYTYPLPRLQTKQLYNLCTPETPTDNEDTIIDIIQTEIEEYNPIEDEREFSDDEPLIKIKKKKRKNGVKTQKSDSEYIEIELNQAEIEEERRIFSMKEDYINAMFRCEKCIMSFPNADDLSDHIRIKHEMHSSKYKCSICECSFSTEVSYNYHTHKHTHRYQCNVCSERFVNKRAVLKHYNIVHCFGTNVDYDFEKKNENDEQNENKNDQTISTQEQIFPCEFCGKTFKWRTSLRKHLETHRIEAGEKRKPYCAPCRISFTTTSNLQKHVRTSSKHQIQLKLRKLTETIPDLTTTDKRKAHQEILSTVNKSRHQFACTQCDKRFLWRGNLLRHLHSHAAKAKGDLVCKPCNKTFSSIATYQQHMKISKKHVSENDFKFMCSDCGKRFPTKSRLRDHINWEHLKNFVYSCDECHKVFKTSNSVYLHKQVHRKDTVQHLCDHCGKPFPNHAKLRSHMLGQHGGAAHACAHCGARFAWHSCLSRHVRHKHRQRQRAAHD